MTPSFITGHLLDVNGGQIFVCTQRQRPPG